MTLLVVLSLLIKKHVVAADQVEALTAQLAEAIKGEVLAQLKTAYPSITGIKEIEVVVSEPWNDMHTSIAFIIYCPGVH